jgi:hypothetical protein
MMDMHAQMISVILIQVAPITQQTANVKIILIARMGICVQIIHAIQELDSAIHQNTTMLHVMMDFGAQSKTYVMLAHALELPIHVMILIHALRIYVMNLHKTVILNISVLA